MVYLHWDHDEHELTTFELQVHTTGWVAFGFSPHGELLGSDIVIGGVFPNGSTYFSFAIPAEETKYACTFIPLPMEQKHRIYKFEPVITPHNITLVHHVLVHACGNASTLPCGIDGCYGANPDFALCSQVLVGWAVGEWTIPLGLMDSSGVRIYYTLELWKYDVGVLQTGIFTFPVHFIPPGAESYRSYGLCNSSQFDEMNGMLVADVHVFAYLLQHLNGEQLRIICEDNKYNFRLQEIRDMKEILIIKPGGPTTMNEMCLTFLFYYPHNNISSCMGYPDIFAVEGMMAIDFVDWDNNTVKIAEKAAKEADQVVMIKTINVSPPYEQFVGGEMDLALMFRK
ncbi:LOW QUALITY PROTEIN: DBH-like monooxygenase protein 2 [Leptosomus discolor]